MSKDPCNPGAAISSAAAAAAAARSRDPGLFVCMCVCVCDSAAPPPSSNSLDRQPLRVYRKPVESIETQVSILSSTAERAIERAFLGAETRRKPRGKGGIRLLPALCLSKFLPPPIPPCQKIDSFRASALSKKSFCFESTATEQASSHGVRFSCTVCKPHPFILPPRKRQKPSRLPTRTKPDTASGASLSLTDFSCR